MIGSKPNHRDSKVRTLPLSLSPQKYFPSFHWRNFRVSQFLLDNYLSFGGVSSRQAKVNIIGYFDKNNSNNNRNAIVYYDIINITKKYSNGTLSRQKFEEQPYTGNWWVEDRKLITRKEINCTNPVHYHQVGSESTHRAWGQLFCRAVAHWQQMPDRILRTCESQPIISTCQRWPVWKAQKP